MTLFGDTWNYLTDPANWQGPGGMSELLLESLLLSLTALVLATLIGLPVALYLGHLGRGGFLAINISNVGMARPTFALLAVLVTADFPGTQEFGPYGRAGLATLIALTLFALPPIITNGYVAIREVPDDVKQAAVGMGMTGAQRFFRSDYAKGIAGAVVVAVVALALELLTAGIERGVDPTRRGTARRAEARPAQPMGS